jgi:diguanylate cyclase (GGDEF)-like protein
MTSAEQWADLTAEQLVRYEALFTLLDDIQVLEDVAAIAKRIATQWKYCAGVTSWRLVVADGEGFQVIDGFRGEARVAQVSTLSPWDEHHWRLQRPGRVRLADPVVGPPPPEHLTGSSVNEVKVLPFSRMGSGVGLLSVAARHEPFGELDDKFVRLSGSHFTDRIFDTLLRRRATEVLVGKATRDALTGLLNRGTIIDRLESQLALSARTGLPLSVVIADIDFFKVINDSHGHLAGDDVLREVSLRLGAHARESDCLGRFGGEEFLVVLYPCSAEEVAGAAERFRRAIAQTPFAIGGGAQSQVTVTISLGTASTSAAPDTTDVAGAEVTLHGLLKRADDALYRSKAGGRNQVTLGNR